MLTLGDGFAGRRNFFVFADFPVQRIVFFINSQLVEFCKKKYQPGCMRRGIKASARIKAQADLLFVKILGN